MSTLQDTGKDAGDGAAEDGGLPGVDGGGAGDGGAGDGGAGDGGLAGDGGSTATAVRINELVADNEGSTLDDLGLPSDWIELVNPGAEPVDLGGYGLSDDWTSPLAWRLPEGFELAPGEHRVLWADGSAVPTADHLPFALSADGEGVGLFAPDGSVVDWVVFPALDEDQAWARLPDGGEAWEAMPHGTPAAVNQRLVEVEVEVLEAGATWAWWDAAEAPGEGWAGRGFDDRAWSRGPAPLGYGEHLSTTISYGEDPDAKPATAWFRGTFAVAPGEGEVTAAVLGLRCDDGAAVYIDGVEVARFNLPSGTLTAETLASSTLSGHDETAWRRFSSGALALAEGEAVVAVEVHQAAVTSSDLSMDLSLSLRRIEEVE